MFANFVDDCACSLIVDLAYVVHRFAIEVVSSQLLGSGTLPISVVGEISSIRLAGIIPVMYPAML
jgi:hypothetical protein